jgi:predicted dehydrogenase
MILPFVDASPIRVGVVGLGYWGPNLARNLQELDGAELGGLCDQQSDRLGALARRYPSARSFRELDQLLDAPDIDAVAIATPVGSHFALAEAALNAGKHVFIEKPLAASSAEAASLIELADERGLVLMPGHTFLYSPPVMLIRELIESGDLGEIYFISMSRVNLGLHQSDVSVAWDLGPHDFSILRYWLGESPEFVSALSRACVFPGLPDVAFINMQFPSETVAHVELSWLAPSKLRRTTIVGSQKMVVYDDTSNEPVRIFDSGVDFPHHDNFGEFRLSYRTGDIISPTVRGTEPIRSELADFCECVRTGSVPRSSAEVGLEVVQMIEGVEASLALRGAPVSITSLTTV